MRTLEMINYKSSQLSDDEIVRRVLAGEKALFEILMRRYNQTVFRVIRGYLKDVDDVQDAMQNSYLKAFDKLSQFRGESSFSTWLIRIAINEGLQRLKQMGRNKVISLQRNEQESDIVHINQIPDKQMTPDKAIIRQESTQLLEQAIDGLPERYRIVYILKEVEGMENDKIMESLEISETNIHVRLHRAKKLLRESLLSLASSGKVFEFGNKRCDAVVAFVMGRI